MRVAGIDLAPGVDDADDRLAGPILGVIADLAQPRAVAERAHVVGPEPAMAAQILRTFTAGHSFRAPLIRSTDWRRAPPSPIWRFRRLAACRNRRPSRGSACR